MSKRVLVVLAICVALVGGFLLNDYLGTVQGQMKPGAGFAAVPGMKGGQDTFGPYDPVANWRKPLATAYPEEAGWTYSQATDVWAEDNRVIVTEKGELPDLPTGARGGGPPTTWLPQIGPGIKFPVGGGVPLRETASATPSCGDVPRPAENINCPMPKNGNQGRPNVDWTWKHLIIEFDQNGNVNVPASNIWAQYDKIWGRPHDVEISPYDPEKHVWIVDADNHFVSEFTNDGSKRILTLGTPGIPGTDDKHFARPTFIVFLDKNTFYLDDGYDGTRVIKYDMSGKKLLQWGQKGTPPNETRPGYFNNVHGIALNPQTHRVYINDRNNNRVQVFDENGKYLDEWKFSKVGPSNIHTIYMGSNGTLWAADQTTHKMLGYDDKGNYLYSWGTFGTCEGCIWGVHGFTTDKDGNLWTASVRDGRVEKFTPRPGANPTFLIGKPWNRNF
jgi:NHL repeat